MQRHATQCKRYNTIEHSTEQRNTIQHNAKQCNAPQYNITQYGTAIQYTASASCPGATQCTAIEHSTARSNTTQCDTIRHARLVRMRALRPTAVGLAQRLGARAAPHAEQRVPGVGSSARFTIQYNTLRQYKFVYLAWVAARGSTRYSTIQCDRKKACT